MPLPIKVEKLEVIPEAHRSLYKPGEGGVGFVLEVEGLEDTSGLKSALKAERDANKANKAAAEAAAAKLRDYDGIDPVQARTILSKFADQEEAALIAAGKIDEVISKRTAKRDAALMKQVEDAQTAAQAAEGRAKAFQSRVLDDAVRAAAAKAGIHAFAVDDALLRARAMFTLDSNGNAVQLDSDGKPVLGKDGKSAFGPSEWLESMKEGAPHWFPAGANGGGASGDKGGNAGGKTITREAFDKMSVHERMQVVKTHKIVD